VIAVEATVIAAVIGAFGMVGAATVAAPLAYLFKRFDRRNSEQHAEAMHARLAAQAEQKADMRNLSDQIVSIKDVVVDHVSWHAHSDKVG
jgi:threonine aldolase